MEDYLDKWKRERQEKRNEERKRLLAYSDLQAEELPVADRYQRIRFLREIEANEWLQDLRRKMPTTVSPIKKRYVKSKNVVIFNND